MDEYEILLLMSMFLVGFYLYVIEQREPVDRRWWVHPTNRLRDAQGLSNNLIKELRENDPKKYKNYMRMSGATFDKLLSLVASDITKSYRSRKPIDPCTKLQLCIRYGVLNYL